MNVYVCENCRTITSSKPIICTRCHNNAGFEIVEGGTMGYAEDAMRELHGGGDFTDGGGVHHAIGCLNAVGRESWTTSKAKGFEPVDPDDWVVSDPPTQGDRYLIPTKLALIHSEVSEALEEFRKGHDLVAFGGELADIVIRTAQLAYGLGIDLDTAVAVKLEKNRKRPHQHGGRLI